MPKTGEILQKRDTEGRIRNSSDAKKSLEMSDEYSVTAERASRKVELIKVVK